MSAGATPLPRAGAANLAAPAWRTRAWAIVAALSVTETVSTLMTGASIADLYGPAAYGTIGAVAGGMITVARAAGPVTAAVYSAAVGYTALMWTPAALALAAAALAVAVKPAAQARRRGGTAASPR